MIRIYLIKNLFVQMEQHTSKNTFITYGRSTTGHRSFILEIFCLLGTGFILDSFQNSMYSWYYTFL